MSLEYRFVAPTANGLLMFAGLKIYLYSCHLKQKPGETQQVHFFRCQTHQQPLATDINKLVGLCTSATGRVFRNFLAKLEGTSLDLKENLQYCDFLPGQKKTSIKLTKWYNHFVDGHHAASFCPSFILLKTLPKRSTDQHWIRSQLWHPCGVRGSTSGYPNWSMEASKDMSADMVNSQSGPS